MMTTASIASTAHADLCMWAQSSFCTLHHFHAFGPNISDRSNTNYYLGICPQKLPVPVMDLGHASLHTPSTSRVSIGSSVLQGAGRRGVHWLTVVTNRDRQYTTSNDRPRFVRHQLQQPTSSMHCAQAMRAENIYVG